VAVPLFSAAPFGGISHGSISFCKDTSMSSTTTYESVTRTLGAVWFLLLAGLMVSAAYHEAAPSVIVCKFCLMSFYLVLFFLLMARPPAKSQVHSIMPRVAAFAGTYTPWTIGFFPAYHSTSLSLVATVCIVSGMVLAIITVLHLGTAFSLVPQARSVVRSGPYRCLRHPLYLAEEIAIVGALLQFLSPITVVIFLIHIGVQLCRIVYEERLLRLTFPEYASYAMTSRRLIPYVW
jgi:protein-S-isoprenylcysteine O-methyltransferase Ste14